MAGMSKFDLLMCQLFVSPLHQAVTLGGTALCSFLQNNLNDRKIGILPGENNSITQILHARLRVQKEVTVSASINRGLHSPISTT
jgi:hypothetical protein